MIAKIRREGDGMIHFGHASETGVDFRETRLDDRLILLLARRTGGARGVRIIERIERGGENQLVARALRGYSMRPVRVDQ